jgi:alpha-tubulin suppressor-like RCC1 family protein
MSGELFIFGQNTNNCLGKNALRKDQKLKEVVKFAKIKQFKDGRLKSFGNSGDHTVIVTSKDNVYGWGYNKHSQLNSGTFSYHDSLTAFPVKLNRNRNIDMYEEYKKEIILAQQTSLYVNSRGLTPFVGNRFSAGSEGLVSSIKIGTKNEYLAPNLNCRKTGVLTSRPTEMFDRKISAPYVDGMSHRNPAGKSKLEDSGIFQKKVSLPHLNYKALGIEFDSIGSGLSQNKSKFNKLSINIDSANIDIAQLPNIAEKVTCVSRGNSKVVLGPQNRAHGATPRVDSIWINLQGSILGPDGGNRLPSKAGISNSITPDPFIGQKQKPAPRSQTKFNSSSNLVIDTIQTNTINSMRNSTEGNGLSDNEKTKGLGFGVAAFISHNSKVINEAAG